jgi:uncharacterized protein (TIGR02301 family)
MTGNAPRPLLLGFGLGIFAAAMLAAAPAAEAQFFWSPWFQEQPKRPKVRTVKPKPPGDDLPPIVPKESSAPPPPDDRPYDAKLLRLTEILGAVHYLRELCGAQEGQLWRNQMKDILKNEGSTAVRRAKLVNSFNDGYRGYRRTYRTCTSSATLAITRFSTEGAQIAVALAKPSVYANRNVPAETAAPENATAPAPGQAAPTPNAKAPGQAEANANPQTSPSQGASKPTTPNQPKPGQGAPASTGAGQGEAKPNAANQGEQPRAERRKTKKAQRARPEPPSAAAPEPPD